MTALQKVSTGQSKSKAVREIPWQMRRDFERNPMRRFVANSKVHAFWTPEDWAILTGPALRMYVQELKAAQEARARAPLSRRVA